MGGADWIQTTCESEQAKAREAEVEVPRGLHCAVLEVQQVEAEVVLWELLYAAPGVPEGAEGVSMKAE